MSSKRLNFTLFLSSLLLITFWYSLGWVQADYRYRPTNNLKSVSQSVIPQANNPTRGFVLSTTTLPLPSNTISATMWTPRPPNRPESNRPESFMTGVMNYPYNSYGSGAFFLPPYLSESERMGFGRAHLRNEALLKAGWYLDWGSQVNPMHPAEAEYMRTIGFTVQNTGISCGSSASPATTLSQVTANLTGTALINNVAANPGALWAIGNEPDSIFNGSPIQAELYADLYHHFYTTIKAIDPTAKIAIGAVVQPSPLRMAYLDRVLNHYQTTYNAPMPIDVWNIHFYILPENECDAGASVPPFISGLGWQVDFTPEAMLDLTAMTQNLRDFRQWMFQRGYGNKPLIISEYGALLPPDFGFSDPLVAQFLHHISTIFYTTTDPITGLATDGNRLLQKWAWFSTYTHEFGGDLFEASGDNLTAVGQAFVTEVNARHTLYVDLQPTPPFSVTTLATSLQTTAYLQNRGNADTEGAKVRLALIEAVSGATATEVIVNLGNIKKRYQQPPALIDYTWQVNYNQQPSLTIPYTITITSLTDDANSANNQYVYPATWWPLADIAVVDLALSERAIFTFQAPTNRVVTATIKNMGSQPVPDTVFQFQLKRGNEMPFNLTIPTFIPALQVGAEIILTTTIAITQPDSFTLTALLPQPIGPVEVTNNNQQSIFIGALPPAVYLPIIQK